MNDLRMKWTPGLDSRCPSYKRMVEMCSHVLHCMEAGRISTLLSMIRLLDQWLDVSGMDPDLRHCITTYAKARGGETIVDICIPFPRYCELVKVLDAIVW